jgi:ADP-heptose:LPS heptosyltransferase
VTPARRALVLHPGALGDVALALPALRHLARLGFTVTLAVEPWLVGLCREGGAAATVLDLEALALHRLFAGPLGAAVPARLGGFDAVVSWLGAGDPGYRAALAALAPRVVVARARPDAGARRHVARHLLETLAPLGSLPAGAPPARLGVGPASAAWAETWLAERGLGAAAPVVVHPGAGAPAKVWPGFGDLLARLRAEGHAVIVSAGPADAPAAPEAPDGIRAAGLPLERLAALIARARAFVGNDSGPTHLAAALGCPTVALFGPTDPAVWAPLGPRVRVVAGADVAAPWRGVTAERVMRALGASVAAEVPAGG